MPQFKPIKSIRVYEQVIDQIREMIYSGKLKRGDKLPSERELKEQLLVSRASIREAFRVLEMIGLIESRPGEGTFIKEKQDSIDLAPLSMILMLEDNLSIELLELRRLLEIESVQLAAERATKEELEEINKYILILKGAPGHEEDSVRADSMFHYAIARASKNKVLYDVMMAISESMDFHIKYIRTKLVSEKKAMLEFAEHHNNIYMALIERNKEKAAEEMRKHLDFVESLIMKERGINDRGQV